VPLVPELMVIQGALLLAVHAQPAAAVTLMLPSVLVCGADTLCGEIVVVHVTPAWVTVTVWPAIVNVPVRGVLALLAAIDSDTVPVPLPVDPPVIVIQGSALVAVHEQPPTEVTVMVPGEAPAATERLVDESVNVHAGAAWVTPKLRPPTVIAAERANVVALAATL
jgi:hypothetical protein